MDPSGLISAVIVFVVLSVVERRREERARARVRDALDRLADALTRPAEPLPNVPPPVPKASPRVGPSNCPGAKTLLAGARPKPKGKDYLN